MKNVPIILMALAAVFTACKKNYTCACGENQSTRTPVFTVHDTKKHAKQKCLDYYNSQANIPEWNCAIQ